MHQYGLFEHIDICGMPMREHDDEVLGCDLYACVSKVLEVGEDDLLCLREALRHADVLPVVDDDRTEAHRCEHWHEHFADMPAAEDPGNRIGTDGLRVALCLLVPIADIGALLRRFRREALLPAEMKHRRAILPSLDEPARLLLPERREDLLEQRQLF